MRMLAIDRQRRLQVFLLLGALLFAVVPGGRAQATDVRTQVDSADGSSDDSVVTLRGIYTSALLGVDQPRPPRAQPPPTVAITFDDGPNPDWTPRVLDILEKYRVHATFFVVGEMALRYPDIVRRIAAEGHSIQGHTWTHHRLVNLSDSAFSSEVDLTNAFLATFSGTKVTCVRPPYGLYDAATRSRLAQRHLKLVMWTGEAHDWTRPGTRTIVNRVIAQLRPGAIILLHDGGGDRSQTVAALPAILDAVRAMHLSQRPICSMPRTSKAAAKPHVELMQYRGWTPQA